MRNVCRLFLVVALATSPLMAKPVQRVPCDPACDGSTLEIRFGNGVPLSTWYGANLDCQSIIFGDDGCEFCMRIEVQVWSNTQLKYLPAGTVMIPPGPSAQTRLANAVCDLQWLQTFSPTWGATPRGDYAITATINANGCLGERIDEKGRIVHVN